ncbi:MAG: hypothetical protein Q4A78_08615 [Peptostreptococcaceae bacterium]|nr:hypothetical protein [Peptostreptococcaceae bacterium]
MLFLRSVRKEGNRIYADYYPEDSTTCTQASISIEDPSDCIVVPTGYHMEGKSTVGHAKIALREMVRGERPIEDTQVMWY